MTKGHGGGLHEWVTFSVISCHVMQHNACSTCMYWNQAQSVQFSSAQTVVSKGSLRILQKSSLDFRAPLLNLLSAYTITTVLYYTVVNQHFWDPPL